MKQHTVLCEVKPAETVPDASKTLYHGCQPRITLRNMDNRIVAVNQFGKTVLELALPMERVRAIMEDLGVKLE